MSMPPYQSVHEKEGEKNDDATQAATNSAQSRFSSRSYPVPPAMPRQPLGPGTDLRHAQEQSFLSEIVRIPPNLVYQLKQELGLDGKEPNAMTFDEKRRLVEAHRQRSVARGSPSSSNDGASASSSASTDMSAAPFTFDFIRSVANSLDKFDPSFSPPDMSAPLFTHDFIQRAVDLDEFDPSFLRPDGDIDFERDFAQWFKTFNTPDDVGGTLESR
ncbi:uncharacterized protein EV420DRAFT_646675 [Desarmillaria tabescens]|uniref:Uncharacterized protein n=1 Tax=Armillaria tabescens TaxID=1929756 RepID=A0AA39T5Z1_ARMTA|nr:uncharacterized protein EV420DRAFT_646675 [Desarmillaria tabescens]KAK0466751.1 hypothetical protein EV420DRAFT_646675 [Desarmillaria tabescens]